MNKYFNPWKTYTFFLYSHVLLYHAGLSKAMHFTEDSDCKLPFPVKADIGKVVKLNGMMCCEKRIET
jgi:hypothetical protein